MYCKFASVCPLRTDVVAATTTIMISATTKATTMTRQSHETHGNKSNDSKVAKMQSLLMCHERRRRREDLPLQTKMQSLHLTHWEDGIPRTLPGSAGAFVRDNFFRLTGGTGVAGKNITEKRALTAWFEIVSLTNYFCLSDCFAGLVFLNGAIARVWPWQSMQDVCIDLLEPLRIREGKDRMQLRFCCFFSMIWIRLATCSRGTSLNRRRSGIANRKLFKFYSLSILFKCSIWFHCACAECSFTWSRDSTSCIELTELTCVQCVQCVQYADFWWSLVANTYRPFDMLYPSTSIFSGHYLAGSPFEDVLSSWFNGLFRVQLWALLSSGGQLADTSVLTRWPRTRRSPSEEFYLQNHGQIYEKQENGWMKHSDV